ncbi:alpha/beta fold hydrolase [Halospeciosus flavus]|uniref:Alpha/beta fold hydrolase n=1 Tax=Halospeciosus flavus TaxID=3032283 RepID=A0ABD5Z110_9EURY|nr:alpha/beta hydrolase [Halospeciosus flavus]
MDHEEWSDRQETVSVTVDDNEVDVAYYDSGPTDGHPVVFVHGIPTWSFLWRDVVDAVPDDQRALALDLAGYGNSSRYDGFDRSIRAQEGVLAEFLDTVDAEGPITLVAHDIGGGVALRYAAHNPEQVENLVLSNAVCYDSWPVEFVSNLGLPETADLDDEELEPKLDFAFGDGLYGDAADHEEFVEGMKAPWLAEGGKTALARAAVGTNTNHTTELTYENITAETTLLWGEDDVLQPISYAERLADDVAGDAEVVPLEDAYHWVVEDRPDAYRTELRRVLDNGEV